MSKYNQNNFPPFKQEDINHGVTSGVLKDDEGNEWKLIKSSFAKTEFYCEFLHLSFPLYDNTPKPIDRMRDYSRFK